MPSRPLVGNERAGGNPGAGRRCRGSQSPLQALGARRDLCCGMQEALLEQQMTPPKAGSRNQPLCRGCLQTRLQLSPGSAAELPQGQAAGSNPAAIAALPSRFTWSSTQPSPRDHIPLPARSLLQLGAKSLLSPHRGSCGPWGQQLPALARLGCRERGLWLHNKEMGTNLKRFGLPL